MAEFRIQSVQTEYYVISNGTETNGSVVATIPKSQYNPSITLLKIRPPPVGSVPIPVTVQGRAGLFVGYKDIDGKLFLSWTDKSFEWIISHTSTGTVNIRPANGQDLFWFDKFNVGILSRIALMPGRDVQEHENSFRITLEE
ncbi:hypothetical protein AX14_012889 [Amanita brunnescens Koide BX004]|nr:hypothetical protein AX14_012889 [Amanita brunnescens Koide BX004]